MSMLQLGLALAFLLAGAVFAMGLYALRPSAPPWLVQHDPNDERRVARTGLDRYRASTWSMR
jgi:hypothetical protein